MKELPLVSIICATFNQEKFIAAAINGFLLQKVNFPIEIIVHDDASTDNTTAIIRDYELKHPHLFNNIYQSDNQYSQCATIVTNITLAAAKGKYIAFCEGDDYWSDPNKLQKQVDFLEANTNYSGCFHNTEERYEDDQSKPSFLYCDFTESRDITFEDISYKNPIPTCSVVFKNNLLSSLPSWLKTLPVGDWPLHLLNAQYGNFRYIPQIMAVHRLHLKGIWGLQDKQTNILSVQNTYDVLINGFAHNPSLQQQIILGKEAFIKHHNTLDNKLESSNGINHITGTSRIKKIIKNILPYFLVSAYQKKYLNKV